MNSVLQSCSFSQIHAFSQYLDDVANLEAALQARNLGGILKARQLIGAGDGEDVGPGLGGLGHAPVR